MSIKRDLSGIFESERAKEKRIEELLQNIVILANKYKNEELDQVEFNSEIRNILNEFN